MSLHQYIGARYVPRFYENSLGTCEWEGGVIYEPLTIVTWNGNSYTSKKTVTANIGDPSSNPDYWAATGVYNAQVAALSDHVDDLDADLNDLAAEVADNASNYPGKAIFCGDSYGTALYSRWPEFLAQYMGYDAADFYNACVDGASFGSQITGYEGGLNTVLSGMSAGDKLQVKLVVLAGGINDSNQNQATIKTNMGHFIETVNTELPNAIVYIGFCGQSVESSAILNGRGYVQIAHALNTFSQCGEFGAHFIPNLQYVLHDYTLMSADGIHPTQDGGKAIARHIASAVRGCGANVTYFEKIENSDIDTLFDFTSNMDARLDRILVLATDTYGIKALTHYINNDSEILDWAFRLGIFFTSAETVNLGEQIAIGMFNDDLFSGKPGYSIPVRLSIKKSDGTFSESYARLLVSAGRMFLRIDCIGADYSSTGVSVTQMVLNPIATTLPTMCC